MAKLIIDGREIEADGRMSLMQACEAAGASIPRFCHHERLSVAGNCRMCLVEVKGAPRPVTSCATLVSDLRPGPEGAPPEILTASPMVRKARAGVMEFLLLNHPLDCPVCDQGGECALQDMAMAHGAGQGRAAEPKRTTPSVDLGPMIRTFMNRCIRCTRCVRFMAEVAGRNDLGVFGRGEDARIVAAPDIALNSELLGNLADICPVGAMLSGPGLHAARPWELEGTPGIDVMDAMGSHITVETKQGRIVRIRPRPCAEINEDWISDKARHVCDGLAARRLDRPWVRGRDGRLREASWEEALEKIAGAFPADAPARAGALAGPLCAVEEAFALKAFMEALGVRNVDCRPPHVPLGAAGGRAGYLFNATFAGVEEADAILLAGANPRMEAAVLDTRIFRAWDRRGVPVALAGGRASLPYEYEYLGDDPKVLIELSRSKDGFFRTLKNAEKPLIILGMGALARPDGRALWAAAAGLARACGAAGEDWNGFCVLHAQAGLPGALDAGCLPGEGGLDTAGILAAAREGALSFLWLLGEDDAAAGIPEDVFVVYLGSHGDAGAARADVVLPGAAWTEKTLTWVNMEGRPQRMWRVLPPPGAAREDWEVLCAAAGRMGASLPFSTIGELRALLEEKAPHLARLNVIERADAGGLAEIAALKGRVDGAPLPVSALEDFWLSNPVARASETMRKMSAMRAGARKAAERT